MAFLTAHASRLDAMTTVDDHVTTILRQEDDRWRRVPVHRGVLRRRLIAAAIVSDDVSQEHVPLHPSRMLAHEIELLVEVLRVASAVVLTQVVDDVLDVYQIVLVAGS